MLTVNLTKTRLPLTPKMMGSGPALKPGLAPGMLGVEQPDSSRRTSLLVATWVSRCRLGSTPGNY